MMSPEELGRKIWDLLGLRVNDAIIVYRDRITGGVLITKEGTSNE